MDKIIEKLLAPVQAENIMPEIDNSTLQFPTEEEIKNLLENDEELQKIVSSYHGKERGHTLSQQVEDRTKEVLYSKYGGEYEDTPILYKRKVGDIMPGVAKSIRKNLRGKDDWRLKIKPGWPGNTKFSAPSDGAKLSENGSPNITSLMKLLKRLIEKEIERYYILYIMVDEKDKITIRFFDLLQNVDRWRHDFGPGQIMLNKQDIPSLRSVGNLTREEILNQIDRLILSKERIDRFVNKRIGTAMSYKKKIKLITG